LTAPPKAGRGPQADLLAPVVIGLSVAILLSLLLVTAAPTLRARLNIVQVVAVLFFLTVAVRHTRTGHTDLSDRAKGNGASFGLWPSLLIGGAVWAVMVPFYFIGDDFEHLALAKGPMFASLWELTVRGQLGAFLRPWDSRVSFLTIASTALGPPDTT
jgi:hypothetical protein